MTLYRLSLELRSPLVTPFKGDTIWGHIVWGIANHEGEDAVAEFLRAEEGEEPALVVGSAFPAGFICRPLPLPRERTERLTLEKYAAIKKEKKRRFIPAADFFQTPGGKPMDRESEKAASPFHGVEITRNGINRVTGTVQEGALFSVEEQWPRFKDWDVYAASTLGPERIKRLFEWAFENGYGADASTGKGKISVAGEPEKCTPKKSGGAYMALGPFVSCDGVSNLRADIFLRMGKTSGAFGDTIHPYKKPVLLYDEGAVFHLDGERAFAGKLLTNMHGADGRICQSGFAPVVAVE